MERMWYYIHENTQKGPVAQDELMRLLQQGSIQQDTYVWTEGMGDWQPVAGMNFTVQIAPAAPRKPTAVTVFGVLNIVFGALGLLCSPIGIVGIMMPQPGGPVYSAAMKVFMLFSSGLGLVMAAVLLAAGIGLLNLKQWARQTSYFYGWFAVIWGVLGTVITLVMMISALSGASGEAAAGMMGGVIGGACGGIIGLIYPIFLIIYMRKPEIVDACNR